MVGAFFRETTHETARLERLILLKPTIIDLPVAQVYGAPLSAPATAVPGGQFLPLESQHSVPFLPGQPLAPPAGARPVQPQLPESELTPMIEGGKGAPPQTSNARPKPIHFASASRDVASPDPPPQDTIRSRQPSTKAPSFSQIARERFSRIRDAAKSILPKHGPGSKKTKPGVFAQ